MLKEIFGICDFHMIHTDAQCDKVRSCMMLTKGGINTNHSSLLLLLLLLLLFSRLFLHFQELNRSYFV